MQGRQAVTPPAGSPEERAFRVRFDRYVLDLDRGCLLLDGNDIALRPKTFAVLRYLVEQSGRLVSKDALFGAIWPGIAVTDDTLVQSIAELRRALGEDGARLIKTVSRRGYRFEPDGTPTSETEPGADDAASAPRKPDIVVGPRLVRWAAACIGLVVLLAVAVALVAGVWKSDGPSSSRADLGERSAIGGAEIAGEPAIAILPFLNEGQDAARVYFADGMTQDIINALGRFSGLTVMSWNAVLPYKGKPASPANIARSLGVRYQVEGSVRQTEDRVRVIAQLVDAGGRVLWSSRFDEALADVFALQDKIATQIAGALPVRMSEIEERRVFAKPTENLAAYDDLLRARPATLRPTRANNAEARVLLRRAIARDPNYAAAYAALAETYYIAVSMGWAESPTEYLGHAHEMADKALSIDDSDVSAHVILGRIDIFYGRYEQAQAEMDRAIAINPNDARGLAGRGNALMWRGQTEAATEALEAAQRIDPELNPLDGFALSLAYYLTQRYNAAIEQAELNLRKTQSANFSRVVLAAAYAQQNRPEDAARVVALIHRMDPAFDPQTFGSKLQNPTDLERLRDGLRKAGLY